MGMAGVPKFVLENVAGGKVGPSLSTVQPQSPLHIWKLVQNRRFYFRTSMAFSIVFSAGTLQLQTSSSESAPSSMTSRRSRLSNVICCSSKKKISFTDQILDYIEGFSLASQLSYDRRKIRRTLFVKIWFFYLEQSDGSDHCYKLFLLLKQKLVRNISNWADSAPCHFYL